jgi:DNA-directed RNA polymerase subunit F
MTEEFLTLAEIKELLTKEQKNRTLTTEQNYSLEHSTRFAKLSSKDAKKLVKELEKIEPLNKVQACKIVDLMPKYPEEIKAVFLKERVTIDDETISKILEKVREFE